MPRHLNPKLMVAAMAVYGLCGAALAYSSYAETLVWPWDETPQIGPPKPAPVFRLADLEARPASTFVSGDNVTVAAKVRNRGQAAATAFDIVVEVSIGGGAGRTFTLRGPATLNVNDEFEVFAPAISIPRSSRPASGVILDIRQTVDPPTATRSRGAVIESNEGNNTRTTTRTIY